MSKKVATSKDINVKVAATVASGILECADGIPLEHSLSVLNGIVLGLVYFVDKLKAQVESMSEEDGLEKLTLSWLRVFDAELDTKFSKYISINTNGDVQDR